jgi:MinD-like ATPase involved in chromosome partitioning or flagellar assembly
VQTITFYSYKGGVGRTLFVANVAKYLARLGQNIFVVDFDLEAPGLHYKFNLDVKHAHSDIKKGVIDYINTFIGDRSNGICLRDYVVSVSAQDQGSGQIHMMPAGKAPSKEYWTKLATISWHELFYSENPRGVPLFLELKQHIEKEFAPDFLIIDSRTGITEIGGIATGLLSDKVVCLLLNNQENLEGAREVLRSIRRSPRLAGQSPIEVLPVLARIPKLDKADIEEAVIRHVLDFLNEEASSLSDTLSFSEIFILHSEPELEIEESLRIGGEMSPAQSPLLRDYLRLITRLVPKEKIQPHIKPLIDEAIKKAIDDPDEAQQELEALTATYPHFDTYLALLKYYRLRNVESRKQLNVAEQLWNVSGSANELVWLIITENIDQLTARLETLSPEFLESAWRDAGGTIESGLQLARAFVATGRPQDALRILRTLLERHASNPQVVIAYLRELTRSKQYLAALDIIENYKLTLSTHDQFQSVWGSLLSSRGKLTDVEKALTDESFSLERVIEVNPASGVRLLQLLGRNEEVNTLLNKQLQRAVTTRDRTQLRTAAGMYRAVNRSKEFEKKVKERMGAEAAKELLADPFVRGSRLVDSGLTW